MIDEALDRADEVGRGVVADHRDVDALGNARHGVGRHIGATAALRDSEAAAGEQRHQLLDDFTELGDFAVHVLDARCMW